MHSRIRQNDERTAIHSQPNTISPERLHIEAKAAQDGGARHFDIEAVFVVDEREVFDFVNDEAFESVVEYR